MPHTFGADKWAQDITRLDASWQAKHQNHAFSVARERQSKKASKSPTCEQLNLEFAATRFSNPLKMLKNAHLMIQYD
jgi:hypothetical protein